MTTFHLHDVDRVDVPVLVLNGQYSMLTKEMQYESIDIQTPFLYNQRLMNEKKVSHNRTKYLVASALFAALTVIGAQLRIPLPFGVPITMQTFFVLLSGYLLGSSFGPLSQVLYLSAGLIGFPVFAEGGGPAYILKPTFGYLIGYPLASYTVAKLVYRKAAWVDLFATRHFLGTQSKFRLALAGICGYLAIFVPGVIYLYLATNYILSVPTAFGVVLTGGFLVFIPGDIIKLTAIMVFLSFWSAKGCE